MDEVTTIGVTELRRAISHVLKRVYLSKERLVIERGGFPMAVLVPYQEYEELMRLVNEKAGRKGEASKTKKT